MIVYDVMDKQSLTRAVEIFTQVLSVNSKAKFAIIGNKCDLTNDFTIHLTDAKSEFYSSLQDNLDKDDIFNDLLFFETSAKLGTRVADAFEHLASHCSEVDTTIMEETTCCGKRKSKGMF